MDCGELSVISEKKNVVKKFIIFFALTLVNESFSSQLFTIAFEAFYKLTFLLCVCVCVHL